MIKKYNYEDTKPDLLSGNSSLFVTFKSSLQPFLKIMKILSWEAKFNKYDNNHIALKKNVFKYGKVNILCQNQNH